MHNLWLTASYFWVLFNMTWLNQALQEMFWEQKGWKYWYFWWEPLDSGLTSNTFTIVIVSGHSDHCSVWGGWCCLHWKDWDQDQELFVWQITRVAAAFISCPTISYFSLHINSTSEALLYLVNKLRPIFAIFRGFIVVFMVPKNFIQSFMAKYSRNCYLLVLYQSTVTK